MHINAQHSAVYRGGFGVARTLLAIFMAVSLFVVSLTGFLYGSLASQLSGNLLDISRFTDQATDENGQPLPEDAFEGRSLNILISGIDSRYNQGVNAHGDPEEFDTIFSDVTMIMHVSADRQRINTVSIPRDLMTDIPSCINSKGDLTDEFFGQFNSAFTTGAVTDDIPAGIACTKRTAEALTGLKIDAFVVVDFSGFIGLVDALGGIHYDVETRIIDEAASADLYPGCQVLNGAQALSYARARKSLGDGSDLGRVGRQQKLVAAMMREALSKNFVTDFPALFAFVQQGIRSLKTSPNLANLNTDIGLLASLASINTQNIQFMTLPVVEWTEDENRVVADEEKTRAIWTALAADLPFPQDSEVTTGEGTKALTTDDLGQSALQVLPEEALRSDGAEDEAVDTDSQSDAPASMTVSRPTPCGPQR